MAKYKLQEMSDMRDEGKRRVYLEHFAGGLCIRSITNYEDNTKSKELSKQVFFYQDGQLSVHPNIYLAVIENSNVGSVYGTFTPIPMTNLFGYHIGYSTVYEEICSEGTEIHKEYKYTNFSDYKDQSCWKGECLYRCS